MNKKKILSLIMALVMLVGVFSPLTAFADGQPTAHNTKVKIHKILMKEHNWNAKRVTITTTTGEAPNQKSTSESKVIITKQEKVNEQMVTKYYDGSDQTTALSEDNEFVKALKGETLAANKTVKTENVFAGYKGLDGTEFKGQELDVSKYFGNDSQAIDGVAFRIYEVYKGAPTTGAPAGYTKGSDLIKSDKLAEIDLDGETYYKLVKVDGKDYVTTENGGIAEVTLPDGTYRIVEDKTHSTYKGTKGETLSGMKAVPFDLVLPVAKPDGTGNYSETDPLNLYPKNIENKVEFDKNFAIDNGLEAITDPNTLKDVGAVFDNYEKEKANAKGQIGKEIKYESKAKLPKGSVFTHLDLADSMDKGLKYKENIVVSVTPALTLTAGTDYTVTNVANGFTLHFEQVGLDKLNKAGENADLEITFKYSATVTADAVNDRPMDNHATFTYNHTPPTPTSDKVKPVNNEIPVTKTWADGTVPSGVKVKYVLLDADGNPVADVTFKEAKKVDYTDLGNGITFEVTGDFSGKFKGLKDKDENQQDIEYRVKEIVNGYEPAYKVESTKGTVTVTNTKTPESITPTPPQVTVGGKKFVKTNQDGTERLAGAEFVIQNQNKADNENYGKYLKITSTDSTAYDNAETDYNNAIAAVNAALAKGEISATNKATIDGTEYDTKDAAMAKIKSLQETRDKEFVKANLAYTWVAKTDEATKFYTNGEGQFEVTGLAYGDYRAVETKAPAGGYALPTGDDNFKFTVEDGSYTSKGDINYVLAESKAKDALQIKNNKVTIPQTGGIGTVLFTVVGIGLMAGAVMAMKKNREEA